MSKVAQYLQEHLLGEVTDSIEVRRHFVNDASILRQAPALIAYPRNEEDVRKIARFSWQLAERGRILPVTARGAGSDTSGAAITSGVMVVFPAHMHRVLALDPKKQFVTLEPGVTYDKLEQTLYTHGQFLPPAPASAQYATIGGGMANNAIGPRSVKYGDTLKYVKGLRVVLANGEVIETEPLGKRELNRKMGLSTFEGQIYRALDALLEENAEAISTYKSRVDARHNSSGYNLAAVKNKEMFNLTPLFVGSQGTLGLITEATLKVVEHQPVTTIIMASLHTLNDLEDILPELLKMKPSTLDMVNRAALDEVHRLNPRQLEGHIDMPKAAVHLFIEFDDKEGAQKKCASHVEKLVEKYDGQCVQSSDFDGQHSIWKIRQSISTILNTTQGQSKAVPVAEDVSLPIDKVVEYMREADKIYQASGLNPAMWGEVGCGVVRMMPVLDLANVGDRQRLFKVADAIYSLAVDMGGGISAAAGDGRVRAPYLKGALGNDMYKLIRQTKQIFDPHGILNPGVKTANTELVKTLMRGEYAAGHYHQHLPRS